MAEKSTSFFQGIKYVPNLEELDQEKQPMKVDEKPAHEKNANDEPLSFSDFCEFLPIGHIKKNCEIRFDCCSTVKPAAKKAMIIGLTMTVCNQLSGAWPLMTYTQAIFEEAGSTLSPNLSAIIVSLVQMAANVLSIVVVDRIDRKKLYSISAIATATGLAALGLHSLYKEQLTEYASIPIVAFSFTIFVASCGILPLHYVILVEIMPKKVRQNRSLRKWRPSSSNNILHFPNFQIQNVANLTCMTLFWGMAASVLQIYPTVSEALGMHSCMFLFATSCCFLSLFTLVVIPETRGKSYETIMRALERQ